MNTVSHKTLLVIGGGAAGFFCAVNAARLYPQLEVILVEKTGKLLSKVKVSGGGRCNVTHACFSIADMVKHYPRGASFLKKSFRHFFTTNTIDWFQERGVALKAEKDGRMFPVTDNSQTIIECLLHEAGKYKVDIRMNAAVKSVEQAIAPFEGLEVTLENEKQVRANYVCVACGGFPKEQMFNWLLTLGHTIQPPLPSLFTFNMPANPIVSLMGITVQDVVIKIAGTKFKEQGPVLITHWGLSGPAVLKLSAWAARDLATVNYSFCIVINWLPAYHEISLYEKMQQVRFQQASQKIINRNPFLLPARFWEFALQQCGIDAGIRWADLPAKDQHKLCKWLCNQEVQVKGKTTFKEEFVTAGGIKLEEVDASTMQSKKIPGLFFAGEILDVDGVTGGFNFQNAWTTGFIAGTRGIASLLHQQANP